MKLMMVGTGLLGRKLIEIASSRYEVFATYNKSLPIIGNFELLRLDITNKDDCRKIVERIEPDFVVLTAALTGVDLCEKEKELAYKINVEGAKNVCIATEEVNAKMIYISTDYVFDGTKGNYKEEDETNPVNYYGYTKLEGEKVVKNSVDDWVIARTSVLYGFNPVKLNFVTWAMEELRKNKAINVLSDQYTSPTFVGNLSEIILNIIEKNEKGIFHASGSERISRHEFALKIVDVFNLNKNLIRTTTSSNMKWVAERPMDSSLNTTKISRIAKPLNIEEGLRAMKGELQ